MAEKTRGKFIVVDGMDGSGKGTQLALLRGKLKNFSVHYTREPGGTELAEEIRTILLRTAGPRSPALCDFFLFWAARASHVVDAVEPQRNYGRHVISDRYDSSTWAFQIYGEQQEFRKLFHDIRYSLADIYKPNAYFFLDLPAEVAYKRVQQDAGRTKTRFDLKSVEYHERVRAGFRFFKQAGVDNSDMVHLIDADRPPEVVSEDLSSKIKQIFDN